MTPFSRLITLAVAMSPTLTMILFLAPFAWQITSRPASVGLPSTYITFIANMLFMRAETFPTMMLPGLGTTSLLLSFIFAMRFALSNSAVPTTSDLMDWPSSNVFLPVSNSSIIAILSPGMAGLVDNESTEVLVIIIVYGCAGLIVPGYFLEPVLDLEYPLGVFLS